VIKKSRYLEIKPGYLQLNAPLFVLAGLNDILWLFVPPIEKSHKMSFKPARENRGALS